jgi:quercetin dioxygenase-like cupin family protein
MAIRKLNKTDIMKTPQDVDTRNLYNIENAMIILINLQSGQSSNRHITPVDVAFYVLKGTGMVYVGGEKKVVGQGSLIESLKA